MRIVSRKDREVTGDSFFTRVTFESRGRLADKTLRVYLKSHSGESGYAGVSRRGLYQKAVEADRDISYILYSEAHPAQPIDEFDKEEWLGLCESGRKPSYATFGEWLDYKHAREWLPELLDTVGWNNEP
jgi:hypothetical protein